MISSRTPEPMSHESREFSLLRAELECLTICHASKDRVFLLPLDQFLLENYVVSSFFQFLVSTLSFKVWSGFWTSKSTHLHTHTYIYIFIFGSRQPMLPEGLLPWCHAWGNDAAHLYGIISGIAFHIFPFSKSVRLYLGYGSYVRV